MVVFKTMSFKEAKNEAEEQRKPMPDGVYKFRCVEAKEGETSGGRPNCRFIQEVIDNPEFNGKKISTFLTIATQADSSGIGYMVDIAAGYNNPWGDKGFDPQSFVGKTARGNVVTKGEFNNIKSYVS